MSFLSANDLHRVRTLRCSLHLQLIGEFQIGTWDTFGADGEHIPWRLKPLKPHTCGFGDWKWWIYGFWCRFWCLLVPENMIKYGWFHLAMAIFIGKLSSLWTGVRFFGRHTDSRSKLGSNIVSRIKQNLDDAGSSISQKSSKHPNTWFHCTELLGIVLGSKHRSTEGIPGARDHMLRLSPVSDLSYAHWKSRTTRSSSICNPNQKWQAIVTIFDTPKTKPWLHALDQFMLFHHISSWILGHLLGLYHWTMFYIVSNKIDMS